MTTFIVSKLSPSKNPTFLKKNSSVLSLTTQSYLNVFKEFAHLDYGINDHFAFGRSDLMDKYLSVCSNLSTIIEEGAAINPETLIGWNAQKHHKLPVSKYDFCYRLWRDM